jgi:hypothetical protein
MARARSYDPSVHIEFTHARTRPYFRRVLLPAAKRRTQPFTVASGGFLIATLVIAIGGEFSADSLLIAALPAVLTVATLAVAGWLRQRALTVPDDRLAPRTWTLTDETYSSRGASGASAGSGPAAPESSTDIAWPDFVSFRTTDDAYVLRHRTGATFDIPREPLGPEQDTELAVFLRAAQ